MARTIELTQGYTTLVDDEDYTRVIAAGPWHVQVERRKNRANNVMYAVHTDYLGNGKYKGTKLHRFVLGVTDPKVEVDHSNRDGLINTRSNLRKTTHGQNKSNSQPHISGSSSFKGVSWNKRKQKWTAQITTKGVHLHLGTFTSAEEAATAYDAAALSFHGEYVITNAEMQARSL